MFRLLFKPSKQETTTGLAYMLIAGILIIIGQFICFIISIIGSILALVGFIRIYMDRYSYPDPHRTNMKISLIFYILGIILSIIGIIALFSATFSWAYSIMEKNVSASELGVP